MLSPPHSDHLLGILAQAMGTARWPSGQSSSDRGTETISKIGRSMTYNVIAAGMAKAFRGSSHGRRYHMEDDKDSVQVPVGFNQQQRQLIEQLKQEGAFGETDGEVVSAVFVEWLKDEGLV